MHIYIYINILHHIYIYIYTYIYVGSKCVYIRRPLPSFGLGGAAPGITRRCAAWPRCLLCTFPLPLQSFKSFGSDALPLQLPKPFGNTNCFCWASKLLSGTSEAPQPVSIGLWNCHLARFQHPLKALQALKPSQQLSTAFRCFAMRPLAAPQTVSVRLRSCYLALPKRHNLFLLGLRSCYLALPRRHNLFLLGLRNCHLARFQHPLKALKPSKPS